MDEDNQALGIRYSATLSVRSQKSEVRSQKSEVRSQKSEVRSQKSAITYVSEFRSDAEVRPVANFILNAEKAPLRSWGGSAVLGVPP
ncbi:hypothetical protein BJP36_35895 [Moorena producens JHB]|uniref:Uncharacterized protein n=1 Tax=Moorena producens (strain JHB) TaxID=1454205 RepID=A0A9Q9STR1_MOOP1|nr:hypothetical protein [Moorena producens]WAN69477.1 hypothetical protein BJP36_35895 [Moorena producens JHB]